VFSFLEEMDTFFGGLRGKKSSSRSYSNCRILFALLRASLAIILLSNVSFETTYSGVYESTIIRAGLAPLNASIAKLSSLKSEVTPNFWWYFPSLMTDNSKVVSVPPVTCSGTSCLSYFLPGSVPLIVFDSGLPQIGKDNFTDATTFVVNMAPGYQIEYYPVTNDDPVLTIDDCQVYGTTAAAIQICVKEGIDGMIGGTI
jgi:hypothetical protein